MKRTFLLLGLAAGLTAAAQQKDIQDMSGLIRQRIEASKLQKQMTDLLSLQQNHFLYSLPKDLKGRPVVQLPNGDLAFRLPMDNMPCVKPGNQQVYRMPLIRNWKEITQPGDTGSIPNPGL
jgi:hypothetical protein